ncbi:MAG: hypothetical protein ACLVJ6_02665 [Merdibacter sp.]
MGLSPRTGGDPWVSRIDEPDNMPETFYGRVRRQYQLNRTQWPNEETCLLRRRLRPPVSGWKTTRR